MRIGNDWVMYDDDEARAGVLGSSAPDTASEIMNDDEAGAGVLGSSAQIPPASIMMMRLGSVFLVAMLQIPPAMIRH